MLAVSLLGASSDSAQIESLVTQAAALCWDVPVYGRLCPVKGKESQVRSILTTAVETVKTQAAAGALAKVPDIEKAVHSAATKAVLPYVIGAGVIGLLGVVFGAVAVKRTRGR